MLCTWNDPFWPSLAARGPTSALCASARSGSCCRTEMWESHPCQVVAHQMLLLTAHGLCRPRNWPWRRIATSRCILQNPWAHRGGRRVPPPLHENLALPSSGSAPSWIDDSPETWKFSGSADRPIQAQMRNCKLQEQIHGYLLDKKLNGLLCRLQMQTGTVLGCDSLCVTCQVGWTQIKLNIVGRGVGVRIVVVVLKIVI